MPATHAAAAAAIEATKASGAIIKVKPEEFQKILARAERPLVVRAHGGLFGKSFQYLTSYKGLVFYTKAPQEIYLSGEVETVAAEKIWVPN